MEKKRYDIWMAGYICDDGSYQKADLLAKGVEADSIINAVRKWYYTLGVISLVDEQYGNLTIQGNKASLWMPLFDNWEEAESYHCKFLKNGNT